jgi:hypothetical protein
MTDPILTPSPIAMPSPAKATRMRDGFGFATH